MSQRRDHRIILIVLFAIGVAALIGIGAILRFEDWEPRALEMWAQFKTLPPVLFFTVMALVCVFPVPISPFYVAAGPLFGLTNSMIWIAPAIVFNQLLAYQLTAGLLRPFVETLLANRGHQIPSPKTASEERLLTTLIRVTPGIPYSLQNWILGLAGVKRSRYLAISWPIQMFYAGLWVLLGQSAFQGDVGIAFFAIGLIIAIGIIARWAAIRLRAASPSSD